jgi:hypothetical protein
MAPRHGFEPRFTAPKAAVLPLDDRGLGRKRKRQVPVYNDAYGEIIGRVSPAGRSGLSILLTI